MMFRSSMREGSGGTGAGGEDNLAATQVLEIEVPDSYIVLLRLLLYLYSGMVGMGNNDLLVEDLVAAGQYMSGCARSTLRLFAFVLFL